MKKEQFSEIIQNLKYEENEWLTLSEIDSIVLNDGRGIYPNWKHMRFKVFQDHILIQHGDSVPYGGRLGTMFNVSNDRLQISFPPGSILVPTDYYSEYRNPKAGDILRLTNGHDVFSESLVQEVLPMANAFIIKLVNPIKLAKEFRVSFYDPSEYEPKLCMHSSEVEGLYMKFQVNNGKEKKQGIFHEIIKVKEIAEIKLKLSVKNKTYTIRG